MEHLPGCGALGVRMVNGQQQFLKESKRGFPSPMVSLWKMTGITGLFPRSTIFAKYYLGHLDENKINKVDVLSGAFMFVRKKVLDITGVFDEFFLCMLKIQTLATELHKRDLTITIFLM